MQLFWGEKEQLYIFCLLKKCSQNCSEVKFRPCALHTSSSRPFPLAPRFHPPEQKEGGRIAAVGRWRARAFSAKNCMDTRGGRGGGRVEAGRAVCVVVTQHSHCVRDKPITKSASQCVRACEGGGGSSACMHAYVPHGMREKSKPHPPKICHSHPGVHAVSKDMMLGEGERECNDG